MDAFAIEVIDPSGNVRARSTGRQAETVGDIVTSDEVYINAPEAGTWTITVIGLYIDHSAFRGRAKLEQPSDFYSGPRKALLPNLQITAPYDIAFGDCIGSEASDYGCQKENRPLRLAAGPSNVGDGTMELTAGPPGPTPTPGPAASPNCRGIPDPGPEPSAPPTNPAEFITGPQQQRIYYSDGTSELVDAGSFEFHIPHHHLHHRAVAEFRLFRVTNPDTGTMQLASVGPKIGFCVGEYLIPEWGKFRSDPPRRTVAEGVTRECFQPLPGYGQITLIRGWGDVYGRDVEGNYVEFGKNPDGLYVLRVATNPDNSIHESDTRDNWSYAYIRITGENVEVLERGRGCSPWDPEKVLVYDTRPPTPASPKTYSRPEDIFLGAISRQMHAPDRAFDVPLPLSGAPGIECRTGGDEKRFQIVVTFAGDVTLNGGNQAQASLQAPGGGTIESVGISYNVVTVNLKGVGDAQNVMLTLNGVTNGTDVLGNLEVPFNVIAGDTNEDSRVNIADTNQTKGHSGELTNENNFRTDVNRDGRINIADTNFVKAHAGSPAARSDKTPARR